MRQTAAVPEIDAEAAAALLRSLGWTVEPPVDRETAIPEPEAGQVWRSPRDRVAPRTVTGFNLDWGKPRVVYSTPAVPRTSVPTGSWRAWARRTGARP